MNILLLITAYLILGVAYLFYRIPNYDKLAKRSITLLKYETGISVYALWLMYITCFGLIYLVWPLIFISRFYEKVTGKSNA